MKYGRTWYFLFLSLFFILTDAPGTCVVDWPWNIGASWQALGYFSYRENHYFVTLYKLQHSCVRWEVVLTPSKLFCLMLQNCLLVIGSLPVWIPYGFPNFGVTISLLSNLEEDMKKPNSNQTHVKKNKPNPTLTWPNLSQG